MKVGRQNLWIICTHKGRQADRQTGMHVGPHIDGITILHHVSIYSYITYIARRISAILYR